VKKTILILGILVIAFLTVGGVWLYAQQAVGPTVSVPATPAPAGAESSTIAQVVLSNTSTTRTPAGASTTPTIGPPVATPSVITVNTSTPVTVTVQITDPSLIPGSVNLLLLGATGTQPTILGLMQGSDNGMYMLEQAFDEASTGLIQTEVSAAFRGQLRRVISPVLQIPVWNSFADSTNGFTLAYPPIAGVPLSVATEADGTIDLNVSEGTGTDTYTGPAFRVGILSSDGSSTLTNWFSQNVDPTNVLAGAYTYTTLPNGTQILLLTGGVPNEWEGGEVSDAYAMSPDGQKIAIVNLSQDDPLVDYGLTTDQIESFLDSVVNTFTFQ
jgi:hypothetical protein